MPVNNNNSKGIRLTLPAERLVAVDMRIDCKPFVGIINEALASFAHKDIFGWHLSLIIDYPETIGDGMPDMDDTIKMQDFSDALTKGLTKNPNHPNALFLGRMTGDGYTQIMWYVNNPDAANKYLTALIHSHDYPLDFNYEISSDPEWSEAAYWLHPLARQ